MDVLDAVEEVFQTSDALMLKYKHGTALSSHLSSLLLQVLPRHRGPFLDTHLPYWRGLLSFVQVARLQVAQGIIEVKRFWNGVAQDFFKASSCHYH